MIPIKINNLLSVEEVNNFLSITEALETPLGPDGAPVYEEDSGFSISKDLGRLQFTIENLSEDLVTKLTNMANSLLDFTVSMSGATYVEYNAKYGLPLLPPHFDGDSTELLINYQLYSNTSWNIGVDLQTYDIEDNSALAFSPNENIHWRPKKIFADEEFVKMIFFRFVNLKNQKDNSHLRYSLDHEALKEVREFRDSL